MDTNRTEYGSTKQAKPLGGMKFSPFAAPFQSHKSTETLKVDVKSSVISTSKEEYNLTKDISTMTSNLGLLEMTTDDGTSASEEENSSSFSNDNGDVPPLYLLDVDFVAKCIQTANYCISLMTREQMVTLRSINPVVLYEFLLEVVKTRSERQQIRRSLPSECAFCKNNGEVEDLYASHVLKDVRGRVVCPVLRAFHCPNCGATGDRAHTIKYCPHRYDAFELNDNYTSRRRMQSPLLRKCGSDEIRKLASSVSDDTPTIEVSQNNWWYGI
ncbi:unnamed protein product [Leptosia nina]|uniref:Nanos-type domain-containing protein n=1 Tax=Leptosia nina TaxID=320188 RepID=A0AAV1K6Z3_9NEOP